MKFGLSAAIMTLASGLVMGSPVKSENPALAARDNCVLGVKWSNNWSDGGLRRYRVEVDAQQGTSQFTQKDMLLKWCEFFNQAVNNDGAIAANKNPQCFLTNGESHATADMSSYEGENGHNLYVNIEQAAANAWREWSPGCDVNTQF